MSSKVPKNLSEEQIKYWLANTNLNREQLIEWYSSFLDFSNKNAKLDKDSFVKFFNKLNYKRADLESFLRLAFNAFDKDNSGSIDFHEFVLAFNILSNGEVKQRLEWMFEVYDQNNDRIIDRKEIDIIIRAILKMSKKKLVGDQNMDAKIDEIFDKLDDNDNQKISKEEFIQNCSNNIFLREILAPDF